MMAKDSALGDSNLVNLSMGSIYYLKLEVQKRQRLKWSKIKVGRFLS